MTSPARGRFITFEGGEGAGKSTQIAGLFSYLKQHGIPVIQTREPGGTTGAESIRTLLMAATSEADTWDPVAEVLLHFAARRQHVAQLIDPALAKGTWVLCDRFFDSTTAYQGYGMGVDLDMIAGLRDLTLGTFRPDLTFLLDIPVTKGLARTGRRADEDTRYEMMAQSFHEKLRNGFLAIARQESDRFHIVDALLPEADIAKHISTAVVARFNLS